MPETTALGAAMAAGAAEGVEVWSLDPGDLTAVTSERFEPQINPEGKTFSCYLSWKLIFFPDVDRTGFRCCSFGFKKPTLIIAF